MPSFNRPNRAASGEENFPAWVTPAILLAINVVAFLLCAFGSPWSYSSRDALLITTLSAIPLAAMGYLTVRVYRCHSRLRDELRAEQKRAGDPARVLWRAEALHNRGRQAQARPAPWPHDEEFQESERAEHRPSPPTSGETGLVAATDQYVSQRLAAGEDLRLDALRSFLNERALDRVEPLQRDHEWAFGIGLAGTVLGLGVQIFLAQLQSGSGDQSNVFSQTFLTGVVLKASSTFVGILVASYARSLRWQLLEAYDRLIKTLEETINPRIRALFSAIRAERGHLAEALHGFIDELKNTVGNIEINLRFALEEAVEKASIKLGESLKDTFATELAESIQAQITQPFRTEIKRLQESIAATGEAISANADGLRQGAREFKEEFTKTVKASFAISDKLHEAGNVLTLVAQKFEDVADQAEGVAQTLRDSQGEAIVAIGGYRSQDRNRDHHRPDDSVIPADVTVLAQLLHEATKNVDNQLASIVQLGDNLDIPLPRPTRRRRGEE